MENRNFKMITHPKTGFLALLFVLILGFSPFLALHTQALSVGAHIPEKYSVVDAGERIYFELEIKYPENRARKDLRLHYELLEDGKVIAQAKVLKAVENQTSFVDYLVVPDFAEDGIHEMRIGVGDYEGLEEAVSASFQVRSTSSELRIYFLILLGVLVFFGIVISWEVYRIVKKK
jgi:uncharacterized protein (DUF58 family)